MTQLSFFYENNLLRNMNIKTKTSTSQMIVNKLKDANLILKRTPLVKTIFFSNTYCFGRPNHLDFEN